MTATQWIFLIIIAVLGHVMAGIWYLAQAKGWRACRNTIYDFPAKRKQMVRELVNSLHLPSHAVILGGLLWFGYFQNASVLSYIITLAGMIIWAEIWHYFSHRAMHLKPLHWAHVEHHKSHLNTPFTAISFNFSEKLIFDAGLLLPFVLVNAVAAPNFYGIATWFIGYLLLNSFQHANFEMRPPHYTHHLGRVLTTTTYHSLHHSRYVGNYGLGTRILDRMFGTEWEDYEAVYARVTEEQTPLKSLRQQIAANDA